MKKSFLICVTVILSTISLQSQLLVDTAKTWSTGLVSNEIPMKSYYTKFEGDTTINSKSYKIIWDTYDEYKKDWNFRGFIREENKKVYFYYGIAYDEILMYDFNLQAGDSALFQYNGYLTVDSIFSKTICNQVRKLYYLSSKPYIGQVIWCEGIGSLSGIMNNEGNIGMTGGLNILLCFTENDTLRYSNAEYNTCFFKDITNIGNIENFREKLKIYPNPSAGNFFLQAEKIINKEIIVSIFNNSGQLVFEKCYSGKKLIEINSRIKLKGSYIIRVVGENLLYTGQLLIH